jgi:hypothetical protein
MPGETKTIPFRVIRADGTETKHEANLTASPTLAEMRAVIDPHLGGAGMELVIIAGSRVDMFVDDLATVLGLPRNAKATEIYRKHWLDRHPGADPESMPQIDGPVVIFEGIVWPDVTENGNSRDTGGNGDNGDEH